MSWQGTAWAARQRTGSATMKNLLMILGNCASPEGVVFARQETLERDTELEEKAVRRNLKRLMQAGFIRIFERRTPDGKRRSNVIVMMIEDQWSHRTQSPVGCAEYFAGHNVEEKSDEAQQKIFAQEALNADATTTRTESPVADAATGLSVPDHRTQSPVAADVDEIDKPLAENEKEINRTLCPPGHKVPRKDYTVTDTKTRARDAGEKPTGASPASAATLRGWYEAHRDKLIETVGEAKFKAWLVDLVPAEDDGTAARFWAASRFLADQVEREFGHVLRRVLERERVEIVFDPRAAMHHSRQRKRERYTGEITLASGQTVGVKR